MPARSKKRYRPHDFFAPRSCFRAGHGLKLGKEIELRFRNDLARSLDQDTVPGQELAEIDHRGPLDLGYNKKGLELKICGRSCIRAAGEGRGKVK